MPADWTGPIRSILVAYDESLQARSALQEAERLARSLGAELTIAAVQEPHVYAGARGVATTELDYVLQEQLEGRLGAQADAMTGVETHVVAVIGDAPQALTATAETMDLVVTGSRGYGPLHSVLVGAVSRHLVDHAPCPVLVVPRVAAEAVRESADVATQPAAS